jgi:seryl-tRNA synthetase
MLDIKWIRDNSELFDQALHRRGIVSQSVKILELDQSRRELQTAAQALQTQRNDASKKIGEMKSKGFDPSLILQEVSDLRNQVQSLEAKEKLTANELNALLSSLPNIPADNVPEGEDESTNIEVRRVGRPRAFGFQALDHVSIGDGLQAMDFERAAKLSGSRFVVLKGALARLERALASFMLDIHIKDFGYTEVSPPALVRDEAVFGTGQLPKFSEDLFRTENGLWLIPTAEVPLTNLIAGEILSDEELPLRFVAYTNCYRSEAGAAGKDTRGMLRQHQFSKVELVSIVRPEESDAEHERMTGAAEEVLKRLELPYRVMLLSSGDMGFSARRTFDLEVWLPGQDLYREISSCSTCGDFQARRMNARFRETGGKGTRFVHTLNGSGVAVGRALIAVIENYQNEDGSVSVPKALQPYMDGLRTLSPDAG